MSHGMEALRVPRNVAASWCGRLGASCLARAPSRFPPSPNTSLPETDHEEAFAMLFLSMAGTLAVAVEPPSPQVEEIRLTVRPAAAAVPRCVTTSCPTWSTRCPATRRCFT